MPNLSNKGHIDRALTNFSVAYQQDANAFIADKVFPIIRVQKQSDVYFTYSKADSFRDEVKKRGQGVESAGFDWNVDTATPYYCQKYALHHDVTEEERVNYDKPIDIDKDTTAILTEKLLLNRERNFRDNFFKTNVWATDVVGTDSTPGTNEVLKWTDPTSDPVADVNKYMLAMAGSTGKKPNFAIMSPDVLYALKQHEAIKDCIKYTQKGVITLDLIAQLFELDNIYVPWAVLNTGGVTATGKGVDNTSFMYSGSMLLGYRTSSPTLKTPSAGYIFAWTGLEGSSAYASRITRIDMPELGYGTQRVEAEMAYDQKVICRDMGTFFANLV